MNCLRDLCSSPALPPVSARRRRRLLADARLPRLRHFARSRALAPSAARDRVAGDGRARRRLRERRRRSRLLERAGRLDALVCNAGYGIFGSVEEVPLDAAREQFETNWFGTLRTLARRAARAAARAAGASCWSARWPAARRSRSRPTTRRARPRSSRSRSRCTTSSSGRGVRVSLIEPGDIRTAFNDATDFDLVANSSYGERVARCRARDRGVARVRAGARDRRARDPPRAHRAADRACATRSAARRHGCRSRAGSCPTASACA